MKRVIAWSVLAVVGCMGVIGCAPGSGEGGGSGGAGGKGQGSAGGQGEGGTGSAACHGDQAAWDAITAKALDCATNADCCVVVNTCANVATVVTAADFSAAEAAYPYCDDQCTKCIAPPIQVGCVSGKCVGEDKSNGDPPLTDELRKSHCGMDAAPVMTPAMNVQFSCAG
jgi:hypothetical protein